MQEVDLIGCIGKSSIWLIPDCLPQVSLACVCGGLNGICFILLQKYAWTYEVKHLVDCTYFFFFLVQVLQGIIQ